VVVLTIEAVPISHVLTLLLNGLQIEGFLLQCLHDQIEYGLVRPLFEAVDRTEIEDGLLGVLPIEEDELLGLISRDTEV
jgi:hypothetical protein